jgi:integrase
MLPVQRPSKGSWTGFLDRFGTRIKSLNASRLERRWRQIRKDTGFEWVTPHTFRKTVPTLISEATTSELASRQLRRYSSQVTRDHYIAKPPDSANLSELLERLAASDDPSPDS